MMKIIMTKAKTITEEELKIIMTEVMIVMMAVVILLLTTRSIPSPMILMDLS